MSTLRVANIVFESTSNNRVQYTGSNTFAFVVGGANAFTINTTSTSFFGNTIFSGNLTFSSLSLPSPTITGTISGSPTISTPTITAPTISSPTISGAATFSSNTLNLGTSSLGTNGYSRLPNGLLLQWGTSNAIGQDSAGSVTFSVAFSAVYSATITPIGGLSTGSMGTESIDSLSTTGFTIQHGGDGTRTFYWMAIGI
jgi:hypothetical protein